MSVNLIKIESTKLSGVDLITNYPISDFRGYLERKFCDSTFSKILNGKCIRQINLTSSTKVGTLRGMHYQLKPKAEIKFVSCLKGSIFDVVVDLRTESKTFKETYCTELRSHMTLVVPEGCAHGFQSLESDTLLLYFHTESYAPEFERGINALDADLSINWPIPITERSDRDLDLPYLKDLKSTSLF